MVSQNYDVVLDRISKKFDRITAVDDISLSVPQGTFLTLLGPSGCGKTTTLRIVGGLERPTQGKVFIKGIDVTEVPPYKRETNLVFQEFALFPHLNVLDNIGFGLRMQGMSKKKIKERVQSMLAMVELPDVMYRKTSQLSGGQRQRVALCRSLILEPTVLLLDEPLGALDARIRKQMQSELRKLQLTLRRTFISVTHDQEEALTMSDAVAIMSKGTIEQIGTPREVYERPNSKFVANFLGECNLIETEIVDVKPRQVAARCPALGTFLFRPPRGWKEPEPGKTLPMMIRPENIEICSNEAPFDNTIQTKVKEVSFKGSTTELLLEAWNREIVVHTRGDSDLKKGDKVTAAWRKENCHLIT